MFTWTEVSFWLMIGQAQVPNSPLNRGAMLLDRFRRVTRDGQWIPEVDGLRFVAICSVLLFHMFGELSQRSGRVIPVEANYWWLERLLGNGDRGVGLFFVISGLILALPFARHFLLGSKPVSLRKYYMRRVTRLEPPYIASMALAIVLLVVYQKGLTAGLASHALASLLYQHNLVFGQMSAVNPVAWSLEVEIQFYIVAPLVMQIYRIRHTELRRTLLLASILGIGLAQRPFQTWPRIEMSILFHIQYFVMGLLVADIFVLVLKTMRYSWIWDLAGVAALSTIFWAPRDVFWPHVLMPIAVAVLCIAAMRSYGLRQIFANKGIAVIGGMCYSIYLLHFLFIAVLFKVTRRAILPGALFFVNYSIQLLLVLLPVTAMCTAFFLLVERPCMDPDWPSKLWHMVTGRQESEAAMFDAGGVS
jgi:peptidoglycan/LPS O-acetylase OafA/YrhL